MNIHAVPSDLRAAVRDVEARYPIKIIGLLPRGSAVHVSEESAIDLLAKKRLGLSLFTVAQAEADLARRLGRPVGIVLTSEVRGEEAAKLSAAARPL
jgi:predicted nucleotidyltransferase